MLRGGLVACALAVFTLCAGAANAQLPSTPVGPLGRNLDSRSVDLASGKLYLNWASVAVGPAGQGGLDYVHGNWWGGSSAPFGTVNRSGSKLIITLGGTAETFNESGGTGCFSGTASSYVQNEGTPSTLQYDGATTSYYYTLKDGARVVFDCNKRAQAPWTANEALLTQIIRPDGEIIDYTYYSYTVPGSPATLVQRPTSIGNNHAYQINFEYASDAADLNSLTLTKVIAFNRSAEYCAPTAFHCTGFTYPWYWPQLTFSNSGQTVTDQATRVTTVTRSATTVTVASSGLANQTYTLDGSGKVTSYNNGLASWSYAWGDDPDDSTLFLATITDPLSKVRKVRTLKAFSEFRSDTMTDKTVEHDLIGRPQYGHSPSGQGIWYAYDDRGNVKATYRDSRNDAYQAPIVLWDFRPNDCPNPKTCNKPYQSLDGRGNATDYTYNAANGAVETVTLPAVTSGGPRPSWAYSYAAYYARKKNASGGLDTLTTPLWMPNWSSHCMVAGCTASGGSRANEEATVTYVGYDTVFAYARTNWIGDWSQALTSEAHVDWIGNMYMVWTWGDASSQVNEVRTRYDLQRRVIGAVGAPFTTDAGQTRHNATRIIYHTNGQVFKTEVGYVTGFDDAAWNNFVSLQQEVNYYDTIGRRNLTTFVSGTTTYAATQYSYNARNEVTCIAQRRNAATFNSLPSDACTATTATPTATSSPDLITTYTYDDDGRVLTVSNSAAAGGAGDKTYTYDQDGQVSTVKDASNRVFTYTYDAHNRFYKLEYPDASTGASNPSDRELQLYDANDNVGYSQTRSQVEIFRTFSGQNQVASSTFPYQSFTYDLSGHATNITYDDAPVASTFNALGQMTSSGGAYGASYQYDSAGRRTRMTWPDGFYVTYEYDLASHLTAIKENGSTTLVSFTYDDFGRRKKKTFFNGQSTVYAYDNASRLTQLNFPAYPHSISLTYDDASRIKSRATTFSGWAWLGHYGVDRTYSNDKLNRLTSSTPVGGSASSYSYDANSNLLSDGSGALTYDPINRPTTFNTSTAIHYDARGRLHRVVDSTVGTRFGYDGHDMISEYSVGSGALLRRYVHGPEIDEPLIWYEGSATGSGSDKRTLTADERGSIILVNTSTGGGVGTIGYDEYGNSTGAVGRFGYTGQAWIPELGQYYYKARMYSPTLGRFMQTDPIRLGAGMNMYAYVGGDPINQTDPSGLRPGDAFASANAAAIDALRFINPVSIVENREYAGSIYQYQGKFYANAPNPGAASGSQSLPLSVGQVLVARYHTHGDYSYFSTPGVATRSTRDVVGAGDDQFSEKDKLNAIGEGRPSYLGTPSGEIKKYDPAVWSETDVGGGDGGGPGVQNPISAFLSLTGSSLNPGSQSYGDPMAGGPGVLRLGTMWDYCGDPGDAAANNRRCD